MSAQRLEETVNCIVLRSVRLWRPGFRVRAGRPELGANRRTGGHQSLGGGCSGGRVPLAGLCSKIRGREDARAGRGGEQRTRARELAANFPQQRMNFFRIWERRHRRNLYVYTV